MQDLIAEEIERHKNKSIFLLDGNVFDIFLKIDGIAGFSILDLIKELPEFHFLVTVEVLAELMNAKFWTPNIQYFFEHIINVEGSFNKKEKESRFIIEEDGKLKYIELNKISAQDCNQILLCQNHPELILVSNDKKLIKSARFLIKDRAVTPFGLINVMLKQKPDNKKLQIYKKAAENIFSLKPLNTEWIKA